MEIVMFNLFRKKKDIKTISIVEINFFLSIIERLPQKYQFIKSQLNVDFLMSFKPNDLKFKNWYSFLLNAKVENQYISEDIKGYFQIKGIKIFNLKLGVYQDFIMSVSDGILIGFYIENINFGVYDLTKIDVSEILEKRFENKDLDSLIKNLNNEEKSIITKNIGSTYQINLKEGSFYFFSNLNDGDVIALDTLLNVYILAHDPFKITKIFSKIEFIEILKKGNLKAEVLKLALT